MPRLYTVLTVHKWMYGTSVEYKWQGKTKALIDIPVPVPFCPPWIAHYLTCDQILTSSVKNQRLPKPWHSLCVCVCAHNLTITESPNTFSISFYLHAWKLPSTLPPFVRNSSLYIISFFPQVFNFSQFLASYILTYSLYNGFISSTYYTGSNGNE